MTPARHPQPAPSRRAVLGAAAATCALAACARAEAAPVLTVYRTASCACCGDWLDRMRREGFTRIATVVTEDLAAVRTRLGVAQDYASCHTAELAGYALEGHVPPADIRRLLAEKPKAVGLAVPGMPVGSPGMEGDGSLAPESFDTLLLLKNGDARTWASHGGSRA